MKLKQLFHWAHAEAPNFLQGNISGCSVYVEYVIQFIPCSSNMLVVLYFCQVAACKHENTPKILRQYTGMPKVYHVQGQISCNCWDLKLKNYIVLDTSSIMLLRQNQLKYTAIGSTAETLTFCLYPRPN